MSRYDVDKFDPTPDPDLMCCICTCILDQPLVSPCQHVFCKLCIEKWLERKKTCPTCRTQILKDELHPVLPLVRNMLNRLTMICDFKQNGCDKVLNMEQFDAHVKDCDFEMVTCRFEHCLKSVLRRDIRQHEENDCDFKEVKCPTCELDVQVKEMSVHNCVAALKNRLKGLENTIKELEDSYKASKEENNDLVKKLEEARWQTLDDSWDSNSSWDSWDSHNDYSRSNTFSDGDNSSFMEFYPPFPSTFDSNTTDPLGLNVNNVDLPSLIIQSPVSFPSVIDTRVAVRSQDETMSVSASENSDNSDRHVTRQNQRLVSERTHSDTNQNQSFLDGYTTLGSAVEEAFRSSAQSVLQTHYQQVSSYESSPSPIRYVSDSPATNNQTRSECNPRSPPEQTASDHGHTSSSVTRVSDQGGTPSSSVIKDVLLAPRNRNRSRRVSTSSISTIYSNVSISSLSPVCNRKSEYCDSASGHSRERSKSYEPSDHYSRHRSRSYEPSSHYSRHRSRSYEQSDHYSRHRSRSSQSSDHYSRERSRSYEPSVDSRSVSSEHARRLDSSDRPRLFERSFCSSVQLSEHVYRRSRSSENYGRRSRSSEHFSRSRSRSPENSILNSTGSRSSQHSVRSWLRSLNNSGRSRSRSSEHCGKSRSWLSNHARSWSPSSDNSRGRSESSRHSRRNIYRSTNHTRRRSWSSDNSRSRSSSRHSGKNIYRLANHTRSRSWSEHSRHSGNRRSRLSDHTKLVARGRSWSRSEYSGRSRSRSQHSGRSKSKSEHSGWSRSKLSHHSRHSSKSRSDLPDQHKRRSRSLEHSFGSRPALLNHSESSESEVSNPSGTLRYSKTRLRSAIRNHFKSFESKCYPKNMCSETKSKSRKSSPCSKGSLKSPSRFVSCSSPSNDSTVVGSTQSSDSGHGEKKQSSTSLKLAKQQSILPFLKYSSTSESSNCHLKNSSNSTNASKSAKKSIFLCNSKKKPASKMSVTKSFHFDSSSLSTELNSVDTCSKSSSRIVNNVSTDGSGINFVRMAKNKGNNKHATTVKSAGEQDINMSNGMQHSLFTNNSVVMQNNIELSISNPRKRKKGANQDSVEQRKTKRIKLTTSESGSTVGDSPKVNVKINLSLLNCPGGIQTNSSATSLEHSRTSPLLKTGGLPISTKPSSVVNSKRSSQTNQKINDETESILDVPTNDMRSVVFRNHTKQENASSNSVSSVSRSYSFRKSTIEKISSHPLESHSEPSIENLRRSSRRPVISSNVSAAASLPSYLLADDTDASWSPNHLDEDSDISFSEHDTSATDSSYEVQVPKPLMQIIDEIVEDDDSDKSWTAGS